MFHGWKQTLSVAALTHGLVNKLLKICVPESVDWKVMNQRVQENRLYFEEIAMAYIFVALKMCYGLDDVQYEYVNYKQINKQVHKQTKEQTDRQNEKMS